MPKQILDSQTVAEIRQSIQAARDGLITDRTDALAAALEKLLNAIEATR